jgi:predicted phosphodiesterase
MRLAIISDIHEDIVSLRLAISKIEQLQCDEIICLGDISGFSVPYYPYQQTRNAHECLAVVKANCNIIIAGNHDLYASRTLPKISPLFEYPNNWYDLDFFDRLNLSGDQLWMYEENELDPLYTTPDREFLAQLPEYMTVTYQKKKVFFSHYLYPNINGTLKAMYHRPEEVGDHLDFVKETKADIAFAGHEHNGRGIIYTENRFELMRYRKKSIPEELNCVLIPAIASGPNRNGFCIFDLNNYTLEIKRF